MEVKKLLQQYSAGKRAFPKTSLREAELVQVNLSKIDLTAADLRQAIMPDGTVHE